MLMSGKNKIKIMQRIMNNIFLALTLIHKKNISNKK